MALSAMCASLAACGTTHAPPLKRQHGKEYFSETEYGVKASPRVIMSGNIPSGGGRYMVGNPYQVRGKTYVPKEDPKYNKSGLASWYGSAFHGRYTANGEVYDSSALTAAHPTFPLPSYARVTNLESGSSVIVRVNDRGPYHEGRILDVSAKTAEMLDIKRAGTAKVNVQYVGRARMDGQDMPFLMASYVRKGDRLPSFNPGGQIATGVMVASNQSLGDQLQTYGSALPQPYSAAEREPSKPRPVVASAPTPRTVERAAPVRTAALPAPAKAAPVVAATKPAAATARIAPVPVQPSYAQPAYAEPRVAQARPAQNRTVQAVQPIARAPVESAATAYVSSPKGKAPQVMFGGVLLQD